MKTLMILITIIVSASKDIPYPEIMHWLIPPHIIVSDGISAKYPSLKKSENLKLMLVYFSMDSFPS